MRKRFLIITMISSMLFIGCKTKSAIGANYTHEVECLGSELDGSVTLKSWGKGKNRADALEQAKNLHQLKMNLLEKKKKKMEEMVM